MKKSNIPVTFGIGIGVLLMLYFLVLAAFGAHIKPVYSLFNGVIMSYGMFIALKRYKNNKSVDYDYEKGFTTSLFTGFNATLFFTLFFVLYSSQIQPDFISTLIGNWSSHYKTSEGLVVFVVFIMGMATTMVLTLTFMQFFKPSWNTSRTKKEMSFL